MAREVSGLRSGYTYDAAGRPTGVRSPDSALTGSRDALGRLLAETAGGHSTYYRYDLPIRPTDTTMPDDASAVPSRPVRGPPPTGTSPATAAVAGRPGGDSPP
ncbi:RHS repeat domain-containing protein [Streptomyces flaveolus]